MTDALIEYGLDIPVGAFRIFAGIFLAFALFRIPYRSYLKEAIGIAIFLSAVNFVTFDILNMPFYAKEIIRFVLLFIAHMVFIKLKPWHAFLVSITGYIANQGVLLALATTSFSLGIITMEQAIDSDIILTVFELLTFAVLVSVGCFFFHKKIGFVFISDKMNFNPNLKGINTLIILSILVGNIAMLLAVQAIITGVPNTFTIAIGVLILFDITLWSIYTRAIREHEIHYSKLNTKQFFN